MVRFYIQNSLITITLSLGLTKYGTTGQQTVGQSRVVWESDQLCDPTPVTCQPSHGPRRVIIDVNVELRAAAQVQSQGSCFLETKCLKNDRTAFGKYVAAFQSKRIKYKNF